MVGVAVFVLGVAAPAGAHNSLAGSNPPDGAVLQSVPSEMTFQFGKAVPLETLSAEAIDASGVRSQLSSFVYGPAGDTEVVVALPALAGAVSVRWRLVGPDGHPITGRVAFSVAVAASSTTAIASGISSDPPENSSVLAADPARFSDLWSMPSGARWAFRWLSYVAMIGLGGLFGAAMWLLPGSWLHPPVRRWAAYAILATTVLAVVQLFVIAGDVGGTAPWASFGSLRTVMTTDAGVSFVVRLMACVLMALLLFRPKRDRYVPWAAVSVLFVVLLGTWAYGGHSRSMRWPLVGVPIDVAHHAAAAVWLGGLVTVSRLGLSTNRVEEMVACVQRFARLAMVSVSVLVVTGVVQAVRLTGSPQRLWSADHGRYLLFKLVLLGVLLRVADINRGRVARRFSSPARVTPSGVRALRRAMGTEFVVGLAVIGVTAAMVVSPPPVAREASVVQIAEPNSP